VNFVYCVVLKITYFRDRICPSSQAKIRPTPTWLEHKHKIQVLGLTVAISAEITLEYSNRGNKREQVSDL